jgi:hypothetical protein
LDVIGQVGSVLALSIALLPLSPQDPGLQYAVLPTRGQLQTLTQELRVGLTDAGIALIPESKTLGRACSDQDCAQNAGRAMHVDRVIFGTVTRTISIYWSTDVGVLDVRTGKMLGELRVGFLGDSLSFERGERNVGQCIARALKHEKPCSNVEASTFR